MRRWQSTVLVVVLFGSGAPASDWPRFRGPNGTGIAGDSDIPIRLTSDRGVLWKVALPGRGHSSPVVAQGKVFLQSASEDGSLRWLLCLDAAIGKTLWQQQAPGRSAPMHPKNSLSSSTPAVDGQRVFCAFWDGQHARLCAFDLGGSHLWEVDLGQFRSQHGLGFSPIVVDGKVIVNDDQDGSAELLAFDAANGKSAWRTPRRAFRACYSTPFVRDLPGGGSELIVVSTDAVTGYNPATGAERWHCNWPAARMPLRTVGSPIFADGLIIANAGDGSGERLCIAVQPGARGNVTDSNLVWQDRKAFPYVPSILAWGKYLYSVNDAGIACCHVARTGELLWQQRLGRAVTASPILAGGNVYVITEDGEVVVFAAGPSFRQLGRSNLGEAVWATPAIADDRLYIRGRKNLYCIGKPRTSQPSSTEGMGGEGRKR